LRLTEVGRNVGLVSTDRWKKFLQKQEQVNLGRRLLQEKMITQSDKALIEKFSLGALPNGTSLEAFLRRPEVSVQSLLEICPELSPLTDQALEQLEISVKYEGYIKRQLEQVERLKDFEEVAIPADLDFASIDSLSSEVKEKLTRVRPTTLGQAGRIQGVTPAAIAVLHVCLRKRKHA